MVLLRVRWELIKKNWRIMMDYKTFYMKQKYRADTYQAGFVFTA